MYRLIIITIVLIFIGISALAADRGDEFKSHSAISLIEQAYRDGRIDRGERIFRNLQAVLAPADLPTVYKSTGAELIPCGTPHVLEALDNWTIFTPAQQAQAAAYMARPTTDSVYISPDSGFAIHYSLVGFDSVPNADLDLDQVPDYVERVAHYADSSYRHYRQNLEYLPIPRDGDDYYDIYLLKLSAYGVTLREAPADSSWNDFTSFVMVHSTFANFPPNDDPDGDLIGAQKVTCAHEIFHAFQFAYDGLEELWWIESSATLFEEVLFPQVNDNYNYLSYFFNHPDTFLTSNGMHPYGAFVWPMYLSEEFGLGFIRTTWEKCRYYTSLNAIDSSLVPLGTRLKSTFQKFAAWNYFTGERTGPIGYDSAAALPLIAVDQTIPSSPFGDITANNPPDGLATNYILTFPDPAINGLLKINFDGSNTVEWGFVYVTFKNGISTITYDCPVDEYGKTACGIYDFIHYDSILFIPCVISPWQDDNQYLFSTVIYPPGDANGSGDVNIQDITWMINFLYKFGPAPRYHQLMGDIDCSGLVNILDISYLIKFLYKGGASPCIYSP